MDFRHYINDVQVEEPDGFEEYEQQLIRDDQERFFRYNFPIDVNFVGDGYDIIEAQYQEDYNAELTYKVTRAVEFGIEKIEFIGIIKISNCQFNLTAKPKPSVNVEIDDNVFQAYIFGNKKRPSAVTTPRSLNNVPIVPVPEIELTMFNPVTGSDEASKRKVYDLLECLRHTIAFISDRKIGLVSDWYSNLPDHEKLAISTGAAIRQPTDGVPISPPVINFEDTFGELSKLYNLYFIVEGVLTETPTLRLETEDYLYGDELVLNIENNDDVIRSMDYEKLYSRISVGSDSDRVYGLTFPMFYTPVLTFVKETYNITGFIGVDNELDLASKWVIDTNEIQKILSGSTTSNDSKIVLIQYDSSTNRAVKGDWFPGDNPAYRYYNEQLTNLNVVNRYKFLGDVVLSLGDLSDSFEVSAASIINSLTFTGGIDTMYEGSPVNFTDDSTPPNFNNGAFDLSLDRFTAQSSGVYRIEFPMRLNINVISGGAFTVYSQLYFQKNGIDNIVPELINIDRYNSSGELQSSANQPQSGIGAVSQSPPVGGRTEFRVVYSFELSAGDYIDARAKISGQTNFSGSVVYSITNIKLRDISSPLNGGEFQTGSPDEYKLIVYSTENEGITQVDWDALQANPRGIINIDTGKNDKRRTYLKEISRKIVSGEATIELISDRNQHFK